ncbi:MAG: patatin-like phospholipase family protein, partial [Candidatus Omnitrophota bacterium]
MKNSRKSFQFIIAVLIIGGMSLQGCATLRARHAVPTDQINNVCIPGMPDVRVVLDNTNIQASIILLEKIGNKEAPKAMPEPAEVNLLAISGGGAGGAFGAGLLCGWTEAGNRPEFHVVTGVSTGAMSAPAAFLGS